MMHAYAYRGSRLRCVGSYEANGTTCEKTNATPRRCNDGIHTTSRRISISLWLAWANWQESFDIDPPRTTHWARESDITGTARLLRLRVVHWTVDGFNDGGFATKSGCYFGGQLLELWICFLVPLCPDFSLICARPRCRVAKPPPPATQPANRHRRKPSLELLFQGRIRDGETRRVASLNQSSAHAQWSDPPAWPDRSQYRNKSNLDKFLSIHPILTTQSHIPSALESYTQRHPLKPSDRSLTGKLRSNCNHSKHNSPQRLLQHPY
ncbi:hypothetical protein GGS26DRAFT_443967 [Hypomontagnella submonticulosa]|nr:hypothetical protein GGS26DRAFT_443967 [Hypomontagnella submonticulosa]